MLFRWSFIGYLVIVYLIGYWSYKQTKGLSEFYVAERSWNRSIGWNFYSKFC